MIDMPVIVRHRHINHYAGERALHGCMITPSLDTSDEAPSRGPVKAHYLDLYSAASEDARL
jgi:hypothetical protein